MRAQLLHSVLLSLAMSTYSLTSLPAADTLATAKKLAEERFAGWTYGSDSSKRQVDCVQFVLAVVEEIHGRPLSAEARKTILIADVRNEEMKPENLAKLVAKNDPRIAGIQKALVDLGSGKAVALSDAKSGDFIQYWMRKKNGEWFGHSALIDHLEVPMGEQHPRAYLYGAHASLGRIGVGPKAGLRLIDADDRRIFIVRYK